MLSRPRPRAGRCIGVGRRKDDRDATVARRDHLPPSVVDPSGHGRVTVSRCLASPSPCYDEETIEPAVRPSLSNASGVSTALVLPVHQHVSDPEPPSPPASSESLYIFIYIYTLHIYGSKSSQKRSKGDSFFSCSLTGLDCAPELVLVAERDRLNRETEPPSRRRHQPRAPEKSSKGRRGAAAGLLGLADRQRVRAGIWYFWPPNPTKPPRNVETHPHFLLPWARQQKPPIFLGRLEPASLPVRPGAACSPRLASEF